MNSSTEINSGAVCCWSEKKNLRYCRTVLARGYEAVEILIIKMHTDLIAPNKILEPQRNFSLINISVGCSLIAWLWTLLLLFLLRSLLVSPLSGVHPLSGENFNVEGEQLLVSVLVFCLCTGGGGVNARGCLFRVFSALNKQSIISFLRYLLLAD